LFRAGPIGGWSSARLPALNLLLHPRVTNASNGPAFNANFAGYSWNSSCLRDRVAIELLLGRSLAFCVHPVAAWPRLDTMGRTFLVASYGAASYAVVLAALVLTE